MLSSNSSSPSCVTLNKFLILSAPSPHVSFMRSFVSFVYSTIASSTQHAGDVQCIYFRNECNVKNKDFILDCLGSNSSSATDCANRGSFSVSGKTDRVYVRL